MFQHLLQPRLLVECDLLRQPEVGLLPLLLCSQPSNGNYPHDDHSHDDDNDLAAAPAWLGPWVFRSGTLCREHEIVALVRSSYKLPSLSF